MFQNCFFFLRMIDIEYPCNLLNRLILSINAILNYLYCFFSKEISQFKELDNLHLSNAGEYLEDLCGRALGRA